MLYPDLKELIACKAQTKLRLSSPTSVVKTVSPGDHHSPFRGRGLEFDSVREYVAGDDVRYIDWRVTARKNSPHLKQFMEEKERHVLLCIDTNSSMRFGTKNTFKSLQAAKIAALLGWRAIEQHHRLGAVVYGDQQQGVQLNGTLYSGMQFFAPKRSRSSLFALFNALVKEQLIEKEVDLAEVLCHLLQAAHVGSLIYIISDFLKINYEQIKPLLYSLTRHCDLVLIAVNDVADRSLPAIGYVDFCSLAKQNSLIDTDDETGRDLYTALYLEERKRLKDLASAAKASLIELTTESQLPYDLNLGLYGVSKKEIKI